MKKRLLSLAVAATTALVLAGCGQRENQWSFAVRETIGDSILVRAGLAIRQQPVTVTSAVCERSAGGIHDFYSEGDYWWPDPKNPDGPYIRRDGETNPENFTAHRHAMIRLSEVMGTLGSAYVVTGNDKYVTAAMEHARAWFVDTTTMMNPNLEYAQAIKGRVTGRGIGIIDTIHLMEVAQAMLRMQDSPAMDKAVLEGTRDWFADYLRWLTTHRYGIDEMNAKNNHGTCWVMQVASFAKFTGDRELQAFCTDRYKTVLLPGQMAPGGSFPLEMERTKPYGYALFNLDAMATICQILSTPDDNLWTYPAPAHQSRPETENKYVSMADGLAFMAPYIADKSAWPMSPDVMYWDEWPVAQPSMIFGAAAFEDNNYFELWRHNEHFPTTGEVVRNLPIRNPLLWM